MSKRRLPARPADPQSAKPVKLTLTVSADTARRFGVHAEMTGVGKSELFAELVRIGCKRFVVSDREREAEQGGDVAA
jgi:hypothetical protein